MPLLLLTVGACGPYDSQLTEEPSRTIIKSTREVCEGHDLSFRADWNSDRTAVVFTGTPLCRDAEVGVEQHYSGRYFTRNNWPGLSSLGLALGGGVVAGLGIADRNDATSIAIGSTIFGLSLGSAIVWWAAAPRHYEKVHLEREQAIARWREDARHNCRAQQPQLMSGRALQVTASYGARSVRWNGTTDDGGRVVFTINRGMSALAAWCGPLHVVIADVTGPRGEQRESTPDAPSDYAPAFDKTVQFDVAAPTERPALASITDPVLRGDATECANGQRAVCERQVAFAVRIACEDSCAERVQVGRCLLGQRACITKAGNNSHDIGICNDAHAQCLADEGVLPQL
ncbi:MAG TPA: hypothetical protein VGL86_10000, partial [Polyangia bacterium]